MDDAEWMRDRALAEEWEKPFLPGERRAVDEGIPVTGVPCPIGGDCVDPIDTWGVDFDDRGNLVESQFHQHTVPCTAEDIAPFEEHDREVAEAGDDMWLVWLPHPNEQPW